MGKRRHPRNAGSTAVISPAMSAATTATLVRMAPYPPAEHHAAEPHGRIDLRLPKRAVGGPGLWPSSSACRPCRMPLDLVIGAQRHLVDGELARINACGHRAVQSGLRCRQTPSSSAAPRASRWRRAIAAAGARGEGSDSISRVSRSETSARIAANWRPQAESGARSSSSANPAQRMDRLTAPPSPPRRA